VIGDMAKKIPKIFKKSFTEEEFNKRIVKKLFIHEYRNFIRNAFVKDENDRYILKDDLDKKELKTLKKIAKSIKSNTGFIFKRKVALVLLILGGIIGFNILFKDKLIERAVERGLQTIFDAKADIRGLKFQIFNARIYFNSLEVADSEEPFRNLFELGKTEVSLGIYQLLKGKVILNNIEFQEIQWGTERTISGLLPGRKRISKKTGLRQTGEMEKQGISLAFLQEAERVVDDILEEEKKNIKTLKLIEKLPRDYKEMQNKWESVIDRNKKEIVGLRTKVKPVSEIKIKNIETLEDALSTYKKVEAAYNEIKKVELSLSKSHKEFKKDLVKVKEDKKKIEESIEGDFAYLSSFIKSPEKKQSIANAILNRYLQKYLGKMYTYAVRGLYYAERLKPTLKQKIKKERPARARGRNVYFPSSVYPHFWLKNAGVSVGSREKKDLYEAVLKNLTSDHDLIDKPTTFALKRIDGVKEAKISGKIDGRSNQKEAALFEFDMKNIPFVLSEGLEFLKVSRMDCDYKLNGKFSIDRTNKTSGTISITLFNIKLTLSDENDIIAKNLSRVLSATPVDIEAGYTVTEEDQFRLKIKSNLDALISGIVNKIALDMIKEAEEKLRSELDKLIKGQLGEYEALYKDFIGLDEDFNINLLDMNNYSKIVEDKKEEIDEKVENIKKQAQEKIEDKAKEELKKLMDKFKF